MLFCMENQDEKENSHFSIEGIFGPSGYYVLSRLLPLRLTNEWIESRLTIILPIRCA